MTALARAHNIADLRRLARRRLPRGIFEFVDRGSEDELSLRENRSALDRIKLRPRVLVDVSGRSMDATILGQTHAMPLAIAPTGAAGLVWHEGEVALARAAAKFGVPFTLATGSITGIEKIAAAGGRLWFQLYIWKERQLTWDLVERARASGFEALLMTVDTAVAPNREYNRRNGFALPFQVRPRAAFDMALHPGWLARVLLRYLRTTGMPQYENHPPHLRRRITGNPLDTGAMRGDNLTWDDLRELRRRWPGKLMVKGVLRGEDAMRAVSLGADAVIVSNHGGRNLDAAMPAIAVLPEIVDAVGGRAPVLLDSGIRRGSDIVKAVALGAQAVLAGRGPLFGTAVAGEAGAAHALKLLRTEMSTTMAFIGCTGVRDLGPEFLQP
ncbi:MAG TPA: alpha-hydroxy acid oxidase, partial [Acetobacteraceae bacterium]|nr:alpha-hydroxy acid oxidase [Acetobacteraceae bacterium]